MDNRNAQYLAELQNQVVQFSDRLHEQFLPAVEGRLMDMADIAKSNEQQWRLLQLVREIKRQRAMMLTTFKKYLATGFVQFQQGNLGGKDTRKEDMTADLSLVADDELERNLAASSLSRRAETRFAEQLYGLNQRLAVLKGGRKLLDDGNPLGPYQFADALLAEMAPLNLDARLTVLFYRLFEKVLLEKLGDLYQSANEYLIKQGVLPNLRYGVAGRSSKASVVQAGAEKSVGSESRPPPGSSSIQSQTGAERTGDEGPDSAALQRTLYDAIRDLQLRGVAPAIVVAPSPPPATTSYVPGYFSQAAAAPPQRNVALAAAHGTAVAAGSNAASASSLTSTAEVVSALAAVPVTQHVEVIEQLLVPPVMTLEQYQSVAVQMREQLGNDRHIGDEDCRLIDLVGMIFEYMLGDRQLPDSVKAVLSYLHTPYLKAALMDRQLFERPEHASRQLLNCLAEAGACWVSSDGDSQFKVFPKIKSVVRRVLTEFRNDMSLFDELLAEMQEFNQKVNHSVALMERRAREKAEGEERLKEVRRRVLHEVRGRMDGRELPSHLVILLLQPWADYLTFTLLRYGEDSSQWQEGVDTIDDLIWSIEAKADINERNRLMLLQEPLQARVQAALETIAYDQAKSNRLMDALQQSHLLAVQNLSQEPAQPERRAQLEADARDGVEDDESGAILLQGASEMERQLVRELETMEFGTWIEFDELDQHRQLRARVAWFNARTSRYMLVDRSGKQVAMKSGLEIARLIIAERARIVLESSKPFFERALENIFARLKSAVVH